MLTKKALRVPSPCNEDNHLTFEGRRLVVSDIQYVNKKKWVQSILPQMNEKYENEKLPL